METVEYVVVELKRVLLVTSMKQIFFHLHCKVQILIHFSFATFYTDPVVKHLENGELQSAFEI